jgi:uncharacterized protein YkwD
VGCLPQALAAGWMMVALASAAAGAEQSQPNINWRQLERQIHQLVNERRAQHNLSPLAWDDKLAQIARAHSKNMTAGHFFSHIDPSGLDPSARGRKAGYECRKREGGRIWTGLAENLYQTHLYDSIRVRYRNGKLVGKEYDWNTQQEIAATTVRGWMESPQHRKNLLRARYSQEGIGIAVGKDDTVYITQEFC